MSKSANRRAFRRNDVVEQVSSQKKPAWWRRRKTPQTPDVGEASTLSPTSVNRHSLDETPRVVEPRKRQRLQRRRLREQRDQGNRLRDWLQDRQNAAAKREKARRRAARLQDGSRGVHRVPEHLVDHPRPRVWVVRHEPVQHPVSGRWVNGMPYRNPKRLQRLAKSGRLRAELRDDDA